MKKILIIATSNDRMGDTVRKTGVWWEEVAVPYYLWEARNYRITIASPKGGKVPVDPESLKPDDETVAKYRATHGAILRDSRKLSEVSATDYDAVFYPGGHGLLWDLATDLENTALLRKFVDAGKPVAAVCHGPGAFGVESERFSGYMATAFSNAEEMLVRLELVVPFSLEDRLRAAGVLYHAIAPWQEYVVHDRGLITGQNPQSSRAVAETVISVLG